MPCDMPCGMPCGIYALLRPVAFLLRQPRLAAFIIVRLVTPRGAPVVRPVAYPMMRPVTPRGVPYNAPCGIPCDAPCYALWRTL